MPEMKRVMLLSPYRRLCTRGRNSDPSGWYRGSWLSSLKGWGLFCWHQARTGANAEEECMVKPTTPLPRHRTARAPHAFTALMGNSITRPV